MASGGAGRKRWTERREVKEPTLYDEWLKQETATNKTQSPRRQSIPLRHGGDTAAAITPSAGTVTALTPENRPSSPHAGASPSADAVIDNTREGPLVVPDRKTSSTSPFRAHLTTTITGGQAAAATTASVPKPRKLVKERAASSRNGASGLLARNTSKVSGHRPQEDSSERSTSKSTRTRSKTSEKHRHEPHYFDLPMPTQGRKGSMNVPAAPSSGAEYLASVPAETSPPSAPSIKSVGSGSHNPLDLPAQRSLSPDPSTAGDSRSSSQRGSSARRILHLMKTLNGRYSGNVLFRRNAQSGWQQIYCYIDQESGDLIQESKSDEAAHSVLVSDLRGCSVRPNADGETPYLEVSFSQRDTEIHMKLLTQVDFDSWYAALLYWQSLGSRASIGSNTARPSTSTVDTVLPPEVPPRASSARKRRDRTGSSKHTRQKSTASPHKEAPVIKVGEMMHWDVGMVHDSARNNGTQETIGRPQVYRTHSEGSRRWRLISGQLRENGELRLHSDADKNLISVVQLSQLSRCSIQRLHPSVMDNDYCIAIYPQYTSVPSENQPGLIRPIFLNLETRVLYEVWFVLLRAFTIPQLYGPRVPIEDNGEANSAELDQGLETMLATQTTDMFRMERTFSIRIIEAKLHATNITPSAIEHTSNGIPSRGQGSTNADQHGYYAEVLLDNETRGKTTVKFDTATPLWGEGFEFFDLPPVLSSASVVVKRRSYDAQAQQHQAGRRPHEANDQQNGFAGASSDTVCGKVEIYLRELEDEKEVEKWWPIVNMYDEHVGEMLIKARAQEGVILMARDYQPLSDVLHQFNNGITLQIAQMLPGELKRISDCLLNIFQVSGKVSDWIMALAEEEIDGIHKETPVSKLRFDKRVGSDSAQDALSIGNAYTDRELIVRDMNKTATFEANLLFRGNTLLTKTLDTHMRRVGREYLEESLGAKLRVINGKDPDCEVDPNRITSDQDKDRNWRRLLLCTQEVWRAILAARRHCPIELRLIFRHVRACAEDRYGDFLRSVSYSSVSGFLFLRFFCPAVLNPKLFGLMKEDIKPRARRTFTLIAKSLQTLSNMASFGSKETWMEPMNAFLTQNRASFKSFIDDVCYVPTPLSAATYSDAGSSLPTYPPGVASAESNDSYNTPITVMQRLPPTSREGFPSLPFLIDQPRAYADLVQLWLETAIAKSVEPSSNPRSSLDVTAAIHAAGGDLLIFHEVCSSLHERTQDCLNRAERAERPNSAPSFKWDELIDQLKTDGDNGVAELPTQASFDVLADNLTSDPSIMPASARPASSRSRNRNREWDILSGEGENGHKSRSHKATPSQTRTRAVSDFVPSTERPPSSGVMSSLRDGLRRAHIQSRGSDSASASISNVSSAVSSDTEHTTGTTALPNYDRELRHRQRREAAKEQIRHHVEASKLRDSEKEKKKLRTPIVSALRKKNQRENKSSAPEGYTSYGT